MMIRRRWPVPHGYGLPYAGCVRLCRMAFTVKLVGEQRGQKSMASSRIEGRVRAAVQATTTPMSASARVSLQRPLEPVRAMRPWGKKVP